MARGDPGEATYTPEVSAVDLPRKLVPRIPESSPIGAAASQFGNALENKFQADSATWAGDKIADFRVKAVQDLEARKAALPAGDPGNFSQDYLKQFDKDAGELIETSGTNPYARAMITQGLSRLRDSMAEHTMTWEATQRVDSQNVALQTNLDKQLPIVRAHPELADQVGATLMDQINSTRNAPAVKAKFGRVMDQALTQSAAQGLADQNPQEVYKQLLSGEPTDPRLARLTDPADRARVLESAQSGTAKALSDQIVQAFRQGGPQVGAQAVAGIDKLDVPGTDPQKESLRNEVREQVARGIGLWHEEQHQRSGPQIMALEDQLAKGKVDPGQRAQIFGLYHSGAYTADQAGAALAKYDRAELEGAQDKAGLDFVTNAYRTGQALDPKNADNKKYVSTLFDTLTAGVKPSDPEYANRAADIAHRTGVMPESAVGWARAHLVGGDPQSAATAANLIDRMVTASPRSVDYAIDKEERVQADTINSAIRAGTSSQVAVEVARKNGEQNEAAKKQLDEQWGKLKFDGSSLSAQMKAFPSSRVEGFVSNSVPKPPPAMVGEYTQLTRDYYRYTGGDLAQSQKLAAEDLSHVWGVSSVNGKPELMPYAPEAMFPGLTAKMVRDDVAKIAPLGMKPADIRLVPTAETARTSGRVWALAAQDGHSVIQVLTDENGRPLRYSLPMQAPQEALEQAKSDALTKARTTQRVRQQVEAGERAEFEAGAQNLGGP